ncbi:MAG TPA: hypothetical protein VM283_06520, partial [Armatimonadota bacterium]|nr:hypothetical protein [Armatimonadota bacterium]
MSLDKDDELTDDETSEETVDEEPEAEERYASEVEVPRGGGCSAGTWVIILVIIAALVYVGVWQVKQNAERRADADKTAREASRSTALGNIAADIPAAEAQLQQGNIAGAIDTLNKMDSKLSAQEMAASTAGDTEAAQQILGMSTAVKKAAADIQAQYDAMQQVAGTGMSAIRKTMEAFAPPETTLPTAGGGEATPPGGEAAPGGEVT